MCLVTLAVHGPTHRDLALRVGLAQALQLRNEHLDLVVDVHDARVKGAAPTEYPLKGGADGLAVRLQPSLAQLLARGGTASVDANVIGRMTERTAPLPLHALVPLSLDPAPHCVAAHTWHKAQGHDIRPCDSCAANRGVLPAANSARTKVCP